MVRYCCYPRWNLDCFQRFARTESIAAQSCQRFGQRYSRQIRIAREYPIVNLYYRILIPLKFYRRRDIRFCKSSFCSSNHSAIVIYPISDSIGNHLSSIIISEVFPTHRLPIGDNTLKRYFYAWRNIVVKCIVAKRRRRYGVTSDCLKTILVSKHLASNRCYS